MWNRMPDGRPCSKMTHAHRTSGTTELQQAGVEDNDIASIANWLRDVQHQFYQKLKKPGAMAAAAGFKDATSYYLWRGQLDPQKLMPNSALLFSLRLRHNYLPLSR